VTHRMEPPAERRPLALGRVPWLQYSIHICLLGVFAFLVLSNIQTSSLSGFTAWHGPSSGTGKPARPVPDAPTLLDEEFLLGDGPWMRARGRMGDAWVRPGDCNPYSGRCDCLRQWLPGRGDPCKAPSEAGAKPVRLMVTGWMTDWPFSAGLHRCRRSLCNVSHHVTPVPPPHAKLFSIINAAETKADAGGSILVGVALESRCNKPSHVLPGFRYWFDLGVSYARGHLDLASSYNNYFPAQLSSRGAPFAAKRDALCFMHSNCIPAHRNKMFDQFANLTAVESFGSCKNNANLGGVLPQCAALPHTGSTVWSQKECMMHHYKFALAIENSRDMDYITEKLWQPLRAGAVPIYWGAPNVRDFLPHPDAAILVEDFSSIADLVAYVKRVGADQQLYEKHMKWKDAPLPQPFVDLIVRRPVDAIFCQACDAVAERYGHSLGPVVGARGGGVHVPPCIRKSIEVLSDPITRSWQPTPAGAADPGFRTYVVSAKAAGQRHAFMAGQLAKLEIGADLVLGFDGADISNETRLCWAPMSLLDSRTMFDGMMGPKVVSLAMKHVLAVWDLFDSGGNAIVVLEDDAMLIDNFVTNTKAAIAAAPAGWDLIVLGSCFGILADSAEPRLGGILARAQNCSRCTHALMWSYDGAKKLLESLPLRWPLDLQLNMAGKDRSWNCYWLEPPIAKQSNA